MDVIISEEQLFVEEVSETELVVVTEVVYQTIEVGVAGPAGPQGPAGASGTGIQVGLLADRPAAPSEGTIYAATDDDSVAIYFE